MTRIVPPKEFVMAFSRVVDRRMSDIVALWYNGKEYSELILDSQSGVLQEVAHTLGLQYWREYLKIDAVFYERVNEVDSFAVAIEHENDAKTSSWEANKLSLLNTPLKVLITYPRKGCDEEILLTKYTEVLGLTDIFDDFASLRRQVLAFAFMNSEVIWRYHVYTNRGFEPLEVHP